MGERAVAREVSAVVASKPPAEASANSSVAGLREADESLDAEAEGERSEPPQGDDAGGASWPDDVAETAFLAEARERGEVVAPAKAREEIAEETDAKALPSLNELVQRIPAEVRDTLEELFRARFVTVKRVPKKALKS